MASYWRVALIVWLGLVASGFAVAMMVTFLTAFARRTLRDWMTFAEEGGMLEALAESEWRERSVVERSAEAARVDN